MVTVVAVVVVASVVVELLVLDLTVLGPMALKHLDLQAAPVEEVVLVLGDLVTSTCLVQCDLHLAELEVVEVDQLLRPCPNHHLHHPAEQAAPKWQEWEEMAC